MLNSGKNILGGNTRRIINSREKLQGYKITWRRDCAEEGIERQNKT
jgi:hypothetical protein